MLCAFDCSSDPLSVAHEELKLEWHNDDDDDDDGDNNEVSSISDIIIDINDFCIN